MKNLLTAMLLIFSFPVFLSAQTNYEKAWKALGENDRKLAAGYLEKARADASTAADAYITSLYLATYNGKENGIDNFASAFYDKVVNPYPYIYSLWFNGALLGDYGKKNKEFQLRLMDKIINDEKAPGTLAAAANYQKGLHYLFSNEMEKASRAYENVGNIKGWQYTGPFENLSQSGFYKNYGPLDHPEASATFKSHTNADVKWFTPATEIKDGWNPVRFQFNAGTAVVYAQNFVFSPADQTVYCNVGVSGSVKLWINDELILAEAKERITELDAYTVKCDLKKGTNRVLIQLGYSGISYPNFALRFTDANYKPLPGITGSASYAAYPKHSGAGKSYSVLPQFAEAWFSEKIKNEPSNLLNYLLLADVYKRNLKLAEARNILGDALSRAPKNSLVRMKLIEILGKDENRTLLLEELAKIKEDDPESLLVMDINIRELLGNEKFDDAAAEIKKRVQLHGEDEATDGYKVQLLVNEKKFEELIKEAEKLYSRYPDNSGFVNMMYTIKKEVYKDKKGAIKVYEKYLANNFNYDTYTQYASLLSEDGSESKSVNLKEKLAGMFPYDPSGYKNLCEYYFGAKKYDQAEEYLKKALALSPYNEIYWKKMGDIRKEKKDKNSALEAYNKSLQYDPNQYDVINQIRLLNGKEETYKLLPQTDIMKLIKNDKIEEAQNADYGYYYIHDQKDVILYPEGATEQYFTMIIRITNEKGIERFKESSISYGSGQNLLIEKAEVIKKNMTKIDGERNGNEVVFTNLEAGDAIVFKYRVQTYVYGRFAKEFWDTYTFGGQIYGVTTRYNLLVPDNMSIRYEFMNIKAEPITRSVENYKMYSWEMLKPEPLKDEPLMPLLSDAGYNLHVSTVKNWNEISNWYSDLSNNKAEEDPEIIEVYKKIFPTGEKSMTEFQRARRIYDYIEDNIRYSSVSFRQSAYVPQRAAATVSTRLGDCKDLSSLFVTLTKMAGIKSQMVLVDTRDNGQKQMILPSLEFNHCIAKTNLDNKDYYIELTDNDLPFASLPNNLNGAAVLEIPLKVSSEPVMLKYLKTANRTKDINKRIIDIKPEGADLNVKVKTIKYGHLSSSIRYTYTSLDKEKQMQEMEKSVAGSYKNNVKLISLDFDNLDKLNDSVSYTYSYKVKNEVSEIGSLQTFMVYYPDVVASMDKFSADKRTFPIEYWSYEDADVYETVVTITAPTGKKFVELPQSESFNFKNLKFSITYHLKTPEKLVVTRRFISDRENIPAADYEAFKSFFEKITKAEKKFIAYK